MIKLDVLSDNPVSPNFFKRDSSRSCAFPITSMMDRETIAVAYRVGRTKHSANGKLWMQTTADAAESWSTPKFIYDGTTRQPRQTVVTGGVGINGESVWIAAVGIVEGLDDNEYMFASGARQGLKRRILLLRSQDRGATWSKPEYLDLPGAPGAGIVTAPFALPTGTFAVPLEQPAPDGTHGTAIVFSADAGRTFGEPLQVAADGRGQLNYTDGRFLPLNNGNILCTLWTFRQDTEETIDIHTVVSTDDGRSWTNPVSTGLVGQVNSALQIPNGTVLLAANVRSEPAGTRLWLSPDRGISWPKEPCFILWDSAAGKMRGEPLAAEPSQTKPGTGVWDELQKFNFGTPTLTLHPKGIILTYWAELQGITHIRSARLNINS